MRRQQRNYPEAAVFVDEPLNEAQNCFRER